MIEFSTDNLPYEKVGKNEPVCIADEVPFEIPDSWEWTRLGHVITLLSGTDFKPSEYNDKQCGIPYITGASSLSDSGVIVNRWTETPRVIANKGDVLLVCKGSGYGKTVICDIKEAHIARQIMAIKNLHTLDMNYIRFFLQSCFAQIKAKGQGVIPGIDRSSVLSLLFPLPPLHEQKRIVAKLFEVMSMVNVYGTKEETLYEYNAKFPLQLKKSILQWAVQGRLVPQDPNDEPASSLLERIRAEKQRLVKEGKIKKDKHESVIFRRDNSHYEKLDGTERCIDDELPFEIPKNWCWCKISTIFTLQAGKNIQAAEIHENPFHGSYPCYGGNGIRGYVTKSNRSGDYPIIGRQGALCGNINRSTGEFYATEHAICVETYSDVSVAWACIFLTALNLNQYATATAQPGLAVANINEVFIPLPPLNEQHRIVQQIEELLPLVNGL